jgi:hypothetical protein
MLVPQYFIDDLKNYADLVQRVYLLIVLVLFVAFGTVAQERPKAILIDEFSEITWEDYVARLDNLAVKLAQNAHQQAYLIFQNGEVKNDRERFRYYRWGKDHLRSRGFDLSMFNFIRAADGQYLKTQLWIMPPGAQKPGYTDGKWNLGIPRGTKPFIWTTTEWSCGLNCTAVYLSLDHFCEVLEMNPRARVNFVIRAKTASQHRKEKSLIEGILLEKCNFTDKRMRYIFLFENRPRWDYPQTEVWLLP